MTIVTARAASWPAPRFARPPQKVEGSSSLQPLLGDALQFEHFFVFWRRSCTGSGSRRTRPSSDPSPSKSASSRSLTVRPRGGWAGDRPSPPRSLVDREVPVDCVSWDRRVFRGFDQVCTASRGARTRREMHRPPVRATGEACSVGLHAGQIEPLTTTKAQGQAGFTARSGVTCRTRRTPPARPDRSRSTPRSTGQRRRPSEDHTATNGAF